MLKEHFWASSFQNFPGGMPLNPPRDSRLAPSALETCLVLFWSLAMALSLWAFVEIISKWEWQVSWFEELHPKPFPYAREINFEAFKIDLKWIPFLVHYRQNLAFGSITLEFVIVVALCYSYGNLNHQRKCATHSKWTVFQPGLSR